MIKAIKEKIEGLKGTLAVWMLTKASEWLEWNNLAMPGDNLEEKAKGVVIGTTEYVDKVLESLEDGHTYLRLYK